MAKKFFYVCAGLCLLAIGFQLGTRVSFAQASGTLILGGIPGEVCGLVGRTIYAMDADGGPVTTWPDVPGTAPIIAITASQTSARALLANGDVYRGSSISGWVSTGNLLSGGPTASRPASWGQVKATYRK